MFSRHSLRPPDIVQPGRDFKEASLTRTVLVKSPKSVEKSKCESRGMLAVGLVGIIGPRRLGDK